MSAPRPRHGKIVPRPPQAPPKPPAASTRPTAAHPPPPRTATSLSSRSQMAEITTRAPKPSLVPSKAANGRGKSKAVRAVSKPISISSTSVKDDDQGEEEDDFEEVPIPGPSTANSPRPVTPTTLGTSRTARDTPGTVTTAPSIFDGSEVDADGINDEEDEDDDQEEDGGGLIQVEIGGETPEERAKRIALASRKKPMTSKDRGLRIEAHKMHVVAMLQSVAIRNRWCNNLLLKARLLSLLPHPLQSAFNIPPSRFPDRAQRSRLFFDALQSLVTWWSQSFFDVSDTTLGLRTRPWDEVQEIVDLVPRLTRADFQVDFLKQRRIKPKEEEELFEKLGQNSGGERLRTVNSLMKKVLQQEGSRDTSAQLFVALARACGLGSRLVVSIQAIPWRAEKVVPKRMSGAGRGGRLLASRQGNGPTTDDDGEEDDDMEEVPIPGDENVSGGPGEVVRKIKEKPIRGAGRRRLQDPADRYRLRKPKPEPQKAMAPGPKLKKKQDLSHQPPVFWAEIFSRSDQRWVPVDPVLGTIRKKTHYEPQSDNGPIRMVYVVAFEEDGYARDVTLRYTKNYGAKTIKLRAPSRKDEPDFWESAMEVLKRPYRLEQNRDELEDAELETSQVSESMPLHLNGFKDHPIYVLERHLKREEVLMPKREIGKFRGESVYRRAHVVSCKTAENWQRIGRRVKERQEPLKWVKQRAVTLNKRRQQEMAIQEGQGEVMQGLYAEWQTEIYRPPPIKDGIIPQNSFGNIDLYAPTMLPKGAVHMPFKGIAKVAKQLEISYAEACTGFEFKKQRAVPVITGIVVAEENEAMVMEAYIESAAAAEEKERAKQEDRALKRWAKLINGLRVKLRLQAEYGGDIHGDEQQENPLAQAGEAGSKSRGKKSAAALLADQAEADRKAWSKQVGSDDEDDEMEEVKPEVTEESKGNSFGLTEREQLQDIDDHRTEDDLEEPEISAVGTAPARAPTEHSEKQEEPLTANGIRSHAHIKLTAGESDSNAALASRSSRRRKAPPIVTEGSSTASSDTADSVKPARNKRKRPSVVETPVRRSLRSRTSKTDVQKQEEQEKQRRLRDALASDIDTDD